MKHAIFVRKSNKTAYPRSSVKESPRNRLPVDVVRAACAGYQALADTAVGSCISTTAQNRARSYRRFTYDGPLWQQGWQGKREEDVHGNADDEPRGAN